MGLRLKRMPLFSVVFVRLGDEKLGKFTGLSLLQPYESGLGSDASRTT